MDNVRQVQVTFDCASPRAVADFWKAALGYVDPPHPPDPDDAWAVCEDPTGAGPRMYFQRVPERKAAKNRVHLDVRVVTGLTGDERLAVLEDEATRLEALGARRGTLLLADGENESCQNMFDVEGNEFCLD
ncbi:VOC family protein [Nocardioides carbamazepini]|uniref:VOC family protein n=1 Tax=Nocardioides carbamazepini TaxID=2854259 RepID=UPI00214A2481|nr:VOC family protein [Nocardioides carbamazepini]MCR1780981.1 VOC family protein [Nocardioides carbamazepini]